MVNGAVTFILVTETASSVFGIAVAIGIVAAAGDTVGVTPDAELSVFTDVFLGLGVIITSGGDD